MIGAPFFYRGLIEELRFWSREADQAEIQLYMTVRPDRMYSTQYLLAWYNFDEGYGEIAMDMINGHNMTLYKLRWNATSLTNGPSFDRILGTKNTPTVIQLLESHAGGDSEVAITITNIPQNGMLYQYLPDGNYNEELDLFQSWVVLEPIDQWASNVTGYSSFWGSGTEYAPQNVIGYPASWDFSNPTYGDSAQAWCPKYKCWKNLLPDLDLSAIGGEYLDITIDLPVYISEVSVYQNYNPGAVSKIYTRKSPNDTWDPMLIRDADPGVIPQYQIFSAPLCQKLYLSNEIRVVLDTCVYPAWHEVDAIQVTGSRTLKPGVVKDPNGYIVYIPLTNGYGMNWDTFEYSANDCPYITDMMTNSELLTIDIKNINDGSVVNPLHLTFQILAGICIFFILLLILFTIKFRKTGQIKFASVTFLILFCVGGIICLMDVYLWSATESAGVCIARVWVLSIGFVVMFGGLFIKTWRVWRIFANSRTLKKTSPISDLQLFGYMSIFIIFDIILLLIFTFWHEGSWYTVVLVPGTADSYLVCTYNPIWPLVFIILFSCAILIFGVFLAISSRHITTTFNESKFIGFAIYNCAFTALIAIPIIIVVQNNQDAIFVMLCIAIIISVAASVGIIYLKKIFSIGRNEDYRSKFDKSKQMEKSKQINQSGTPAKVITEETQVSVSKYQDEIKYLKEEVSKNREEIKHLKEELTKALTISG